MRESVRENCDIGKHNAGVLPATDRQLRKGSFSLLESKMNARATRVVLVCVVGIFLAWAATPAMATLLVYENFNGTAGELNGVNTGGTGLTGAWTATPGFSTLGAGLSYTANGNSLVTSGFGVSSVAAAAAHTDSLATRNLTSSIPGTGTYYVSTLISEDLIPVNDKSDYYGMTLPGSNLVIGSYQAGLMHRLGVYDYDAGTPTSLVEPTTGGTHLLVAKLEKDVPTGNLTATIWIDPTSSVESANGAGTTGLAMIGSAYSGQVWTNIGIVDYSRQTDDFHRQLSDFRIGTTFADVTPGLATPEPSAIVLVLSGMVALLAYAWRKRR
jgi:hypothetical protein